MKMSTTGGKSQHQCERHSWGEQSSRFLQVPEKLTVSKAAWGGSDRSLGSGQRLTALAQTQCPPAAMGTVLCSGSDFWGKRNQTKDDESVVAAMKHEKGKNEHRNSLIQDDCENKTFREIDGKSQAA